MKGTPKYTAFTRELAYIPDVDIREYCKEILEKLPEYIYHVGASSTGKYHPSYSLGEGGLVRHMRGAMGIAIEMFNNETICKRYEINSDYDKSIILFALAIHDGFKSGTQTDYETSKYTKHEHPVLMASFLMKNYKEGDRVSKDTIKDICRLIMSHMGQWNKNPKSAITLPKPLTPKEEFVHLCDYLGSRKCLEFNFDTAFSYLPSKVK